MTHEEIGKLEAGPDLDLLMAEKIMGWFGAGLKAAEVGVLWCPSVQIAAAWEVMGKVRARLNVSVIIEIGRIKPEVCEVTFYDAYKGYHTLKGKEFVPVEAPTTSLAICRAALKAVGA